MGKLFVFLILGTLQLFAPCEAIAALVFKDLMPCQWRQHYTNPYLEMRIDTIAQTMVLEPWGDRKSIISTAFPFFPSSRSNTAITLNVRYKTKNCQRLSVVLTSICDCENIISTDISLPMTSEWQEISKTINVANPCLLNVSIEGVGIENKYAVGAKMVEHLMNGMEKAKTLKEKAAAIWISDLRILIDGKEATCLTEIDHSNVFSEIKDAFHWNSYNELPFMNSRILALGESMHGTKTLQHMGIDILKERIIKHDCKEVIFEWPLEMSFYIDRFIKNDSNFTLEEILRKMSFFLYDDELTASFLNWLKEYNLCHAEKVSFRGIDVNVSSMKSQIDLFDFFHTLNKNRHVQGIDSICKLLASTSNKDDIYGEVLTVMNNCPTITDVMDNEELTLMRHCLNMLIEYTRSKRPRFYYRDQAMAETTMLLIDNFLEKEKSATLYAHLDHSDYADNQMYFMMNYPYLGYQLKNRYKNDYTCIGMLAYQGSAFLKTMSGNRYAASVALDAAPLGSLEHQLNRIGEDSLYLAMDNLECSDIFSLRETGNTVLKEQFSYVFPKARMEGVLFVKEVAALKKRNAFMEKEMNHDAILVEDFKRILDIIKNK